MVNDMLLRRVFSRVQVRVNVQVAVHADGLCLQTQCPSAGRMGLRILADMEDAVLIKGCFEIRQTTPAARPDECHGDLLVFQGERSEH